ncbi:hypothetical protein [Asticcacaulis taihuensis]|uniref:hypothetical protein n=1 Tax=Asticcacaulis taihuensis TaxID=260084 RepID=UPI003F7C4B9E
MKSKRRYFWGGPLFAKGRKAALEEIRKDPVEHQARKLNVLLGRVTEKTGGVLAVGSIVFGVTIFVLDKATASVLNPNSSSHQPPGLPEGAVVLCFVSICISMVAIMCLCANLTTVWRRDNSNWNPTEENLALTLNLFARRTIRLQISLFGIATAAILSFLALTCLEGDIFMSSVNMLVGCGQTLYDQALQTIDTASNS